MLLCGILLLVGAAGAMDDELLELDRVLGGLRELREGSYSYSFLLSPDDDVTLDDDPTPPPRFSASLRVLNESMLVLSRAVVADADNDGDVDIFMSHDTNTLGAECSGDTLTFIENNGVPLDDPWDVTWHSVASRDFTMDDLVYGDLDGVRQCRNQFHYDFF